ncbi:MAG: hypothetical protein CMP45_06065 [Rickettsiales bacterium]|nr:hypothetical protein [Rickettsiales bacterium]
MRSFVPIILPFLLLTLTQFARESKRDLSSSFDWSSVNTQAEKAKYILNEINEWHNQGQVNEGKKLRVVYFYPKDRKPLANHIERWDKIMNDIQEFFSVEMKNLGYEKGRLSLEKENGKLKLHEVRGAANDDGTYSYKSGNRIYNEVSKALAKKGIEAKSETLLIVCGLSKTDGKKVQIYSPYYGMGANQNKGICFVADSDWLNINGLKVDKTNTKIQVKEHRGYEPFTLARFNTTYIGGTIHELGHGLSLPHNLATKSESSNGTALMGAGNYTYRQEWRDEGKGSFLTNAHAIRLLVHPVFSGTSKDAATNSKISINDLSLNYVDKVLHLRGKIKPSIPAIAMIAYNDGENKGQKRYQVNNDYDATTWTSVLSPNNEFWIKISDLKEGNHQIRLVSVHANGSTTTHRIHYSIKDGKPSHDKANKEIKGLLAS